MARPIPENDLEAIEDVVRRHPGGATARQIADGLAKDISVFNAASVKSSRANDPLRRK